MLEEVFSREYNKDLSGFLNITIKAGKLCADIH
jgi:hypothetical protein